MLQPETGLEDHMTQSMPRALPMREARTAAIVVSPWVLNFDLMLMVLQPAYTGTVTSSEPACR